MKAYVSHPSAGRGWVRGRRIAPIRRIAGECILSLSTATAGGRDDELRWHLLLISAAWCTGALSVSGMSLLRSTMFIGWPPQLPVRQASIRYISFIVCSLNWYKCASEYPCTFFIGPINISTSNHHVCVRGIMTQSSKTFTNLHNPLWLSILTYALLNVIKKLVGRRGARVAEFWMCSRKLYFDLAALFLSWFVD